MTTTPSFEKFNIFNSTIFWLQQNAIPFEAHPLTESTNLLAKNNAHRDPPFKIYLADQQSQGRGRGHHRWISPPPGAALLITWSLATHLSPQQLTAPIAGLALYRAAEALWPHLHWSLKAPNDIYLQKGKVGGLLVECVSLGEENRLLIGLGFNVNARPVDVDLATCLGDHEPSLTPVQWQGFLHHLHKNFLTVVQDSIAMELNTAQCQSLFQALQKNIYHQNLKSLTQKGDLVYQDGSITPWIQL
ncbi:MAG: hypothetical protein K1X29_03290 [Bdellovibrionales bacterium]|nr:hypothetical protein [Bdellovibrionales bacterium]